MGLHNVYPGQRYVTIHYVMGRIYDFYYSWPWRYKTTKWKYRARLQAK